MRKRRRNVLVIDGHPDADMARLGHAMAAAYRAGAEAGGHEVRTVTLATLDIAPLGSRAEWETGEAPRAIGALQQDLLWADHLVILFPLWLGDMPGLLKGLFEQLLRPGYAFAEQEGRLRPRLARRSARLIVTMGMPALIYRLWFGAHAVRLLRRNILGFVGIGPVRASLFGMIDRRGAARRALRRTAALGRRGR
ncbi:MULTISPECIES: NAD(P)H-dependent oxidoreductase [unclassified Sphingomonas]|uniref:NAD(P)H-dependent oxidoreductase n=1 Tax=unclassified Sphingomonas TaxID=196159 RepID=UPI0006F892AA|nr:MULTISPECIES: NAD(P)H-dependent oxidoreductase [unclassified Sphingomonas]KQX23286.1 hypothetical protein ASD17_02925 [Sphingomonas sp. Root1294]KQY68134.1 hypothetical protein ASD39_05445 [Sphingomonas sp. Root50]KRB91027.1 hypothetical protein ASE22_12240 [Sphingomonas sp. Root720]